MTHGLIDPPLYLIMQASCAKWDRERVRDKLARRLSQSPSNNCLSFFQELTAVAVFQMSARRNEAQPRDRHGHPRRQGGAKSKHWNGLPPSQVGSSQTLVWTRRDFSFIRHRQFFKVRNFPRRSTRNVAQASEVMECQTRSPQKNKVNVFCTQSSKQKEGSCQNTIACNW